MFRSKVFYSRVCCLGLKVSGLGVLGFWGFKVFGFKGSSASG